MKQNLEAFSYAIVAVVLLSIINVGCSQKLSSSDNKVSSYNSNTITTLQSETTNSSSQSTSASAKKAFVITENANLRKSSSSTSGVIQVIPEGTNVEVIKQQGAWFLVENSGQSGWMHGNTIRFVDSTQSYSDISSRPDSTYQRTSPGYDPDAPQLPRHKGDIEPLYNEVQRLKEQQGMTDKEAVNKILRDAGEIP
jgi:uncharacterized protein YraI